MATVLKFPAGYVSDEEATDFAVVISNGDGDSIIIADGLDRKAAELLSDDLNTAFARNENDADAGVVRRAD